MTQEKGTEATPKSTRSKVWSSLMKYGIPLVITVGLCWLLFRDFDFGEMMRIIRRDCDFRWIGAALCISVLSHVIRGYRWNIQLRALGIKAPVFAVILSIFGTYAVNLVFPRLGELWRTGYISARQKAPFNEVFGSMVADRLSDSVAVLILILLTFCVAGHQLMEYLSRNGEAMAAVAATLRSPMLWTIVAVVAAITAALLYRYRRTSFVGKLKSFALGLWQGFAVVVRMPGRGRWLLLTVAIWACYFTQLYLAFFAFPLTAEVVRTYSWTAVLVCFVLSSISMGVPSNGGIGPWQWAVIFGLSLYPVAGLTKEYATTFANLVMGTQTLLLIALGIFTFICIAIDKRRKSA